MILQHMYVHPNFKFVLSMRSEEYVPWNHPPSRNDRFIAKFYLLLPWQPKNREDDTYCVRMKLCLYQDIAKGGEFKLPVTRDDTFNGFRFARSLWCACIIKSDYVCVCVFEEIFQINSNGFPSIMRIIRYTWRKSTKYKISYTRFRSR